MYSLLVLIGLLATGQSSLDEALKAHQSTIDSLHDMELTVDHYMGNPLAKDPNRLVLNASYHFWFDAERARMICKPTKERTSGLNVAGEHSGYRDVSIVANEMRAIVGFDPNDPPYLGEFTTSRAHGGIERPKSLEPFKGIDDSLFYLNQKVMQAGERMSLKQLLEKAVKTTDGGAQKAADGRKLRLVLIELDNYAYKVFLDPGKGFLIHRVECTPNPSAAIQAAYYREVVSYQEVGGLKLPKVIVGSYSERGHTSSVKTVCTVISCNRTIPDESFRVSFPEWLTVNDQIAGKYYVWGKDNKPLLTFDTSGEFENWWLPRYEKAVRDQTRKRPGLPWLTIGLATSLAIVVLLLVVRRWRERRA